MAGDQQSTTCPACGGIVGRDCFNVPECIEITRQMEDMRANSMSEPPWCGWCGGSCKCEEWRDEQ